MIFAWLKQKKSIKNAAAGLYQAAVAQSRDPRFYTDLGVSDTVDGRFDMISLHVCIIMERLNRLGPEGKQLSQALFDYMFLNMELTLREIGIGDMGVPKHMKKMMKAFNGRVHSYHAALNDNDKQTLELAVSKNIYRSQGGDIPAPARMLAAYTSESASAIMQQDYMTLAAGRVSFPTIDILEEAYA